MRVCVGVIGKTRKDKKEEFGDQKKIRGRFEKRAKKCKFRRHQKTRKSNALYMHITLLLSSNPPYCLESIFKRKAVYAGRSPQEAPLPTSPAGAETIFDEEETIRYCEGYVLRRNTRGVC